jgi:hypothetical protein
VLNAKYYSLFTRTKSTVSPSIINLWKPSANLFERRINTESVQSPAAAFELGSLDEIVRVIAEFLETLHDRLEPILEQANLIRRQIKEYSSSVILRYTNLVDEVLHPFVISIGTWIDDGLDKPKTYDETLDNLAVNAVLRDRQQQSSYYVDYETNRQKLSNILEKIKQKAKEHPITSFLIVWVVSHVADNLFSAVFNIFF